MGLEESKYEVERARAEARVRRREFQQSSTRDRSNSNSNGAGASLRYQAGASAINLRKHVNHSRWNSCPAVFSVYRSTHLSLLSLYP